MTRTSDVVKSSLGGMQDAIKAIPKRQRSRDITEIARAATRPRARSESIDDEETSGNSPRTSPHNSPRNSGTTSGSGSTSGSTSAAGRVRPPPMFSNVSSNVPTLTTSSVPNGSGTIIPDSSTAKKEKHQTEETKPAKYTQDSKTKDLLERSRRYRDSVSKPIEASETKRKYW